MKINFKFLFLICIFTAETFLTAMKEIGGASVFSQDALSMLRKRAAQLASPLSQSRRPRTDLPLVIRDRVAEILAPQVLTAVASPALHTTTAQAAHILPQLNKGQVLLRRAEKTVAAEKAVLAATMLEDLQRKFAERELPDATRNQLVQLLRPAERQVVTVPSVTQEVYDLVRRIHQKKPSLFENIVPREMEKFLSLPDDKQKNALRSVLNSLQQQPLLALEVQRPDDIVEREGVAEEPRGQLADWEAIEEVPSPEQQAALEFLRAIARRAEARKGLDQRKLEAQREILADAARLREKRAEAEKLKEIERIAAEAELAERLLIEEQLRLDAEAVQRLRLEKEIAEAARVAELEAAARAAAEVAEMMAQEEREAKERRNEERVRQLRAREDARVEATRVAELEAAARAAAEVAEMMAQEERAEAARVAERRRYAEAAQRLRAEEEGRELEELRNLQAALELEEADVHEAIGGERLAVAEQRVTAALQARKERAKKMPPLIWAINERPDLIKDLIQLGRAGLRDVNPFAYRGKSFPASWDAGNKHLSQEIIDMLTNYEAWYCSK